MKSWADYNSSDDENEDDFLAPENNPPIPEAPLSPVGDGAKSGPLTGDDEGSNRKGSYQRPKKEFVLPERPPFTAFVGNLAFSVKNPDELGQRIAELTTERFGKEINVTASRVAIDRRDGKHKGFGYVEVETLDNLKVVLELDDGQSMVAGRPIHLDVAQAQSYQRSGSDLSRGSFANRSSSFGTGEIDASKFQGGRHLNKKGPFRRQGSSSSDIPQQRPSLKLQPRRKDRDNQSKGSSSSNIFGGAKPRDEGTWERGRSSVKLTEKEEKGQSSQGGNNERRASRSGGRGGGRSDRGRGSMKNVRQSSNTSRGSAPNNKKEQNKKDESSKASTAKATVVKAPTVKTNKTDTSPPNKSVINKFAALNFDDSDEE